MHEKAKCVCFIYMQPKKVKFKYVQINMKQVSYKDLRSKYIAHYYWRQQNMFKFIELLNTANCNRLRRLCAYVFHAFKL